MLSCIHYAWVKGNSYILPIGSVYNQSASVEVWRDIPIVAPPALPVLSWSHDLESVASDEIETTGENRLKINKSILLISSWVQDILSWKA